VIRFRVVDQPGNTGKSLASSDLEKVIRRAVELAQVQVDADDRVSEAELIRIGSEIGLPADKVRQALYDQPQLVADPKWYDRYYDTPIVAASRVIPADSKVTVTRLEEYLSAREYMQLVRRKAGELRFIPAEDAISRLARGLSRPGSRYHLAHARRLVVNVQQIGEGKTHIRIDGDFSEQRAASVKQGIIAGGFLGFIPGSIGAAFMAAEVHWGLPGFVMGMASMGLGIAAGAAAGVRVTVNMFRTRLQGARSEIEGLLDRAEHSDRLEPPPAPWRRSLRAKFFGNG
jgi:hypothetical protein